MALQGMGVSTFWGFTPAIDLQNAPPAARSAGKWKAAGGDGGGAPLRVLVAGEGDVRNRDTDGAVLDDKFDKQALPKVMQVKDFGFQGRTKYTHLADQDTTFVDRDNPFNGWLQSRVKKDDPLRKKYEAKMGGSKDIDASFRRRK